MGRATTVLATFVRIAKLRLPINVVMATALTENIPGGRATIPETCACMPTELHSIDRSQTALWQ